MGHRDYLELASESLRMAQDPNHSINRATLLEIAGKWLQLAGETADARAARDLLEAMKQSPTRRE